MTYEESLLRKETEVRDLLFPVLKKYNQDPVWQSIIAPPENFAYRNKMEFTFGDEVKDGPLTLGMHKKGRFHDIVSVTDCQIVDEDFRLILRKTLEYFSPLYEKGEVKYYHRKRQGGYLRHLLVRKGINSGQILVDLVTTTQIKFDLSGYIEALLALKSELTGTIVGILNTRNDALADAIIDEGTELLYGTDSFEESLLGIKFKVTPFSFFQTNSKGAEVLYEKVREYVKKCVDEQEVEKVKTLFDLYCGTGTITQLMSPVADKVSGIEIVPEAVEAAKENAIRNNIKNTEFICGDVLKKIDELKALNPEIIILDPPRDGINPKALPKIISFGAKNIIYVACKPKSLARDLPFIIEHGYEVKFVVSVDQFPWTRHVETVCLLSKLHKAKHLVSVTRDIDEMDITSAESKDTYEEI